MKRNQWAAAILAILLFCCGAAVGALGQRYYNARAVNPGSKRSYVSEMRSKLNLTPAQVTLLESILDNDRAKYKAVRDAYRPQMLKIRSEHIARVKSILTPQQVPVYEGLIAEHERRAKEQEERERQQEQNRATNRK